MTTSQPAARPPRRVRTAGAIVRDGSGRFLLVRRGRPPGLGMWSVPGGHVECGESDEDAVRREVREETGLDVAVGTLVGALELAGPPGTVFDNRDYACTVVGGTLTAGDDAADVAWFTAEEVRRLPTTDGLVDVLTEWGVLC